MRPLVIGELVAGEPVHVFESQWDGFDYMDKSGERDGIALADLIELMTHSPSEASALVEAMVDIANNHQVGAEHLFRGALRSYQEHKHNYFEDIEESVEEFDNNYGEPEMASTTRRGGMSPTRWSREKR